jgi:deoxyribose-phosphate aldolase
MIDADKIAADAISDYEVWEASGRPTGFVPPLDLTPDQVAKLIDHTQLKPDAGEMAIRGLCNEAKQFGFASVCVHSSWTPFCADILADSPVAVCTVTGFPQGTNITSAKRYEALKSIEAGASEIDMVIHIGRLKDGDYAYVLSDIAAVAECCHENGAILKTIIETCLLSNAEKAAACALAKAAGADFVKTSTGFNGPGANVEDVALMRHVVGPDIGVKAAGGVHNYEELVAMGEAGATRIGASAGVQIVEGMESANGG